MRGGRPCASGSPGPGSPARPPEGPWPGPPPGPAPQGPGRHAPRPVRRPGRFDAPGRPRYRTRTRLRPDATTTSGAALIHLERFGPLVRESRMARWCAERRCQLVPTLLARDRRPPPPPPPARGSGARTPTPTSRARPPPPPSRCALGRFRERARARVRRRCWGCPPRATSPPTPTSPPAAPARPPATRPRAEAGPRLLTPGSWATREARGLRGQAK
jgi:hypothetical protein